MRDIFKYLMRVIIIKGCVNIVDKTIEFVKKSTYRQKVLKSLENDNVLMPIEIAKLSNIKTNHVSKVLAELKNKELIEIINPEVRKGRLYRLTDVGDEMVKKL